jgi:hypothetical protein
LEALPREQALEIIYDTLAGRTACMRRQSGSVLSRKRKRTTASLDRNYRGMFMFADPNQGVHSDAD